MAEFLSTPFAVDSIPGNTQECIKADRCVRDSTYGTCVPKVNLISCAVKRYYSRHQDPTYCRVNVSWILGWMWIHKGAAAWDYIVHPWYLFGYVCGTRSNHYVTGGCVEQILLVYGTFPFIRRLPFLMNHAEFFTCRLQCHSGSCQIRSEGSHFRRWSGHPEDVLGYLPLSHPASFERGGNSATENILKY